MQSDRLTEKQTDTETDEQIVTKRDDVRTCFTAVDWSSVYIACDIVIVTAEVNIPFKQTSHAYKESTRASLISELREPIILLLNRPMRLISIGLSRANSLPML